jgi:hypothetical protein
MSNWTAPKTIVQGGAALSSDWNTYVRDNSQYLKDEVDGLDAETSSLESRTTALEQASLVVETAESNAVELNFSEDRIVTRTATGAVSVTGVNYTAGKSITLRIVPGSSSRSLSFPAAWNFVSFKPTTIAADKTGVLAVTAFGNVESDAVAAWAVQS